MTLFEIIAALLALTAGFSYLNHRVLRFPTAIGLMAISLGASLILVLAGHWGLSLEQTAESVLGGIDFSQTLMGGMLSFLLFAGALHVNLEDLQARKWVIGILATIGVLVSTVLVSLGFSLVSELVGLQIPFAYCLVFGALISPTDPIAVLAILKSSGAPRSLEAKITGESLFNDGIGVVLFAILLGIANGTSTPGAAYIGLLLLEEVGGGVVLGLGLGWLTYRMLRTVDNYQVEILLTLALVTGSYALAQAFHFSGPISVVLSGLLIGNRGRLLAMSRTTREHLDAFWELVDEILNGVLFVLIGLEVLLLRFTVPTLILGLGAAVIVLCARFLSVGIPVTLLRRSRDFSPAAIRILTWGGLRGGISVALALAIPPGPEREIILPVTYCVVVLSILGQGLTIGKLIQKTQHYD